MMKLGYTNPPRLLVKRRLQKLDAEELKAEHTHICGASAVGDMTKEKRMQLILDKLEENGTFNDQEAEWKRQACTSRNQSSVDDVCKATLACTTLGSSVAMLTVVISVKTLTKSVAVARLGIEHGTKAGQGTWKCSLRAEFVDAEQISVCARVEGFETNASHDNRQSSPQPIVVNT